MADPCDDLSPDRRFVLVRLRDVSRGVARERVRLELASSRDCVLDLTDAGCRVDSACFDARNPALLHLRLSREDGAIVMYPATLDLDSGLYYHGDPRHAHAPAGRAEDLEGIARGAVASGEFDRGRPVRWPDAQRLEREARPAPIPAEPPAPEPAPPEPAPDPHRSADGRWRMEAWTFEDGPEGWQGHARIVDTAQRRVVFDLQGSNWYSRARFNPAAYQLWMNFQHADGRQFLHVFIDLDTLLYWQTSASGDFLPGRMPGALKELQQQLVEVQVPQPAQPPAAAVEDPSQGHRSIDSTDGRYRFDLFPSGRSEPNARGAQTPLYHVLVTDIEQGRIVADTRRSGEEAWLLEPDGLTMELAPPASQGLRVVADLRESACWLENHREPLSVIHPLRQLAELLPRTR